MEGIAMPKPPTAPKFVTFGSPTTPEKYAPDMTNTFLLVAIAGGILIVYALSRVIGLQRRIKDLESRPPMDDIVMRTIIRQEISSLVNSPLEPPSSIDTLKAEYVPPRAEKRAEERTRPETERAEREPAREPAAKAVKVDTAFFDRVVEPLASLVQEDEEEEEEEEREPTPPPSPKKKRKPSKSKKVVTEVDLS